MEIKLTQGKSTFIDDADWPLVSQFKWHAKKEYHWYVATCADGKNGDFGQAINTVDLPRRKRDTRRKKDIPFCC